MAWRADNYEQGWGLNRARRSPRLFAGGFFAADFQRDRYGLNGGEYRGFTNVPGYSFSRASTGYALTQDGVLQAFSSGVLRRTDRGALIEPARTNLLLRSQDFENAGWTKTRASVTADQAIAPDGTVSADKLVEDSTAANSHYVSQVVTTTAGATLSMSVYVKAAERSAIAFQLFNGADQIRAAFNLATGAIGDSAVAGTASLAQHYIEALGGGWYRCVLVGVASTSATFVECDIFVANAGNLAGRFYSGDGTSGIYIWGAQVEAGTGASSYIPTTSATATRAADQPVIAAALVHPLTLFVEYEPAFLVGSGQPQLTVAKDGAGTDFERLNLNGSAIPTIIMITSGVTQAQFNAGGAVTQGSINRLAGVFSDNDVRGYSNGIAGTPDISATSPSNLAQIYPGWDGGTYACAYIKRLAVFPRALTNAQLQALTA